jgi:hypothetical protein
MAEAGSSETKTAGTRRRTRRTSTRSTANRTTTTTRRRRAGGVELVDNLNQMVDQLIKENRKLRRQVEQLASRGTAAAGGTIERGLRSIQRRVQRAIGGSTTTRRRATRGRSTTGRRRTTTRRRTTSGASSSSSS